MTPTARLSAALIGALLLGVLFAAFAMAGCSNAPPNHFHTTSMGAANTVGAFSTSRLPNLTPFAKYPAGIFFDTSENARREYGSQSPRYRNDIDFFTVDFFAKTNHITYGAFMSNLYPGLFLGSEFKFIGFDLFCTASWPGKSLFPGVQGYANGKYFYSAYSFYRQNLGSTVPNPAFGEEGPYRKVWSERYNGGIQTAFRNLPLDFALGLYLDRTRWNNVYVMGLELTLFNSRSNWNNFRPR
jgi:hypothetical protein